MYIVGKLNSWIENIRNWEVSVKDIDEVRLKLICKYIIWSE